MSIPALLIIIGLILLLLVNVWVGVAFIVAGVIVAVV